MSREIKLTPAQWEQITHHRLCSITDPFYPIRRMLLALGESWGYTEADLTTGGIIAPPPKAQPGGLKGSRRA